MLNVRTHFTGTDCYFVIYFMFFLFGWLVFFWGGGMGKNRILLPFSKAFTTAMSLELLLPSRMRRMKPERT